MTCKHGTTPAPQMAPMPRALQERGRELAIQVQDELGSDGWEVPYQIDGQMFRVHPAGSWPVESWKQDLLGYHSRSPAE